MNGYTEREQKALKRIRHRYLDTGATDDRGATHEFGQNFPEVFTLITRPKPLQADIHAVMLEVADAWLEDMANGNRRPGGMILSGPVGVGKTALASLLLHELASLAGLRPSFVSCLRMREDLRGLPSDRKRGHNDYHDACNPEDWPALLMDDVGREAGNVEACDLVKGVLDIRTQTNCFTVWTCNKDQAGLAAHLGDERDVSRASLLKWIQFPGVMPDYRVEVKP